MDFRPITIEELLHLGRALFVEHHREVGIAPNYDPMHKLALDINEGGLLALERANCLLTVAAFEGDDLVGYAIAVLSPHMLANTVVATGVTLYVHPKHRNHGSGARLLYAIVQAGYDRASSVHWHAKEGSSFQRILLRAGARELERIYVLRNPDNG